MSTDALVPETFITAPPETIEDAQAEDMDRVIGTLAVHPGWIQVKADFEARIADYRTLDFGDDLSNEEVGKRHRVAVEIARVLESILKEVEIKYEHSRG